MIQAEVRGGQVRELRHTDFPGKLSKRVPLRTIGRTELRIATFPASNNRPDYMNLFPTVINPILIEIRFAISIKTSFSSSTCSGLNLETMPETLMPAPTLPDQEQMSQ